MTARVAGRPRPIPSGLRYPFGPRSRWDKMRRSPVLHGAWKRPFTTDEIIDGTVVRRWMDRFQRLDAGTLEAFCSQDFPCWPDPFGYTTTVTVTRRRVTR